METRPNGAGRERKAVAEGSVTAGSRSRLGRSGERALRVLFGEGAMSGRSDADLIRGFNEAHGEAAEAAEAKEKPGPP